MSFVLTDFITTTTTKAVEMESAALYLLAAAAQVQGLAIFTVSDHVVKKEYTTAEEREKDFNDMVKIALETVIQ